MAFTIGNALGISDNPLYKTLGSKRNALMGFGAGLASGNNFGQGIANGLQGAATGAIRDDAYALMEEEKATQLAQTNKTAEWLQSQGYTDLLPLVEAGQGSAALSEAFKRMQPGYGAVEAPKPLEVGGVLLDPVTYQPIFDSRQPEAEPRPPMNATIQKEIFDTDDAILSGESAIDSLGRALNLNATAYDGPLAEQRGGLTGLFGDPAGQATIELKNEVTTNALNSLKAIFGAAPTEGERQILLDIQGSPSQPRDVRQRIFEKALEAAQKRLAFNQQKAAGLRTGDYFTGTPTSFGAAPTGSTTSTGLTWSIEP